MYCKRHQNILFVREGDYIDKNSEFYQYKKCLLRKNLIKNKQNRNYFYINFVGSFFLKKEYLFIISLPKNYDLKNKSFDEIMQDMSKIIKAISFVKYKNNFNMGESQRVMNEKAFPLQLYSNIEMKYIHKFHNNKVCQKNRVPLREVRDLDIYETIKKEGVFFDGQDYVSKTNRYHCKNNPGFKEDLFLENIIKHILIEGSLYLTLFGERARVVNPCEIEIENSVQHLKNNYEIIIDELNFLERNFTCIDFNKVSLIRDLKEYLEWFNLKKDDLSITISTSDFNLFFENLNHFYLNQHFANMIVDVENQKYEMIFSKNNRKFKFEKGRSFIFCEKNRTKIVLDHFYQDDENKVIYAFDSKYYSNNNKDKVDDKQYKYFKFLEDKYPGYKIYCCLLKHDNGNQTSFKNTFDLDINCMPLGKPVIFDVELPLMNLIENYLEIKGNHV